MIDRFVKCAFALGPAIGATMLLMWAFDFRLSRDAAILCAVFLFCVIWPGLFWISGVLKS